MPYRGGVEIAFDLMGHENPIAYTDITDLASRGFWNLRGTITQIEAAS